MSLVMVDLEGTLSDHTDRLAILQAATVADPRNREAWKIYYKGLPDDEPREYVLRAVKTWIETGHYILVYSTRFKNKYEHEKEWLVGHELFDKVILRQRDQWETRIKGPDLVAEWAVHDKPHILIDDRVEVRDKIRHLCPDTMVLAPEDFPYEGQRHDPTV